MALLRPLVAAHPSDVDAVFTLALVEADRGDDVAALDLLQRLEPLVRQSHTQASLARLARLEPPPDHLDAAERRRVVLMLTATALGRLGRTAEARQCVAEADKIEQTYQELAEAVRAYRQRPQDLAALEKAGLLYLKVGMPDDGTAALERVLEENPQDLAAHRALAELYESSDDPELRRRAEPHRRLVGPPPTPPPGARGP